MAVEIGAIAPWLDNYPITRQLWAGVNRTPGSELKLVPTSRNLTVQFRNSSNTVVLASSELQSAPLVRVLDQSRGLVQVTVYGIAWNSLKQDETYTVEILAYGLLYDSFPLSPSLPTPHEELISGTEVYGAPREILELIGRIPGAVAEISVNLSGGWTKNAEGYWIKTLLKGQPIFGLWVNDYHARQVASYADLALGCDRQFCRIAGSTTDTLYYKGTAKEDLADPATYVETAHNRYVLRCLQEATSEFERKAGRLFAKRRFYRELHRATHRMEQVTTRCNPVQVDAFFRLDCYSRNRTQVRRYSERNTAQASLVEVPIGDSSDSIHVDSPTGIITLTQSFFDWLDWGNDLDFSGFRGTSYYPPGETGLEITYTAGFDEIPVDVSEAVANMAAIRQAIFWQQNITQGMQSMNIGCVSMNFGEMFNKWIPSWQQSADQIIGNYQHFEIEAF